MSNIPSPEFEAWANKARKTEIHDVYLRLSTTKLRKVTNGFEGPCPVCSGTDRFGLNTKENFFYCRNCNKGGDAISMVQWKDSCSFGVAVEFITGEAPPNKIQDYSKPLPDESIGRERRESEKLSKSAEEDAEKAKKLAERKRIQDFFKSCKPFHGTLAETYLKSRRIVLTSEQSFDLRCADKLDFYGYADAETKEQCVLGSFPAMIAAIRDVSGEMIGMHTTYLNRKTGSKLSSFGDPDRFKAKKVRGAQKGGFIALSPPSADNCSGEGIESTASFPLLHPSFSKLGMIVGINLDNLCGGCTGSAPHPKYPKDPRRVIPNGVADPDKPGVVLPSHVKNLTLLGDGDSDFFVTRAKILAAARRRAAEGVGISVAFAPDAKDFNDVLRDLA